MKKTMVTLVVMLVALVSNVFGADKAKVTVVTGVYTLVTVNGSELPATVSHGDAKIMVHSGTFTINADKTCVSKIIFGAPSGEKVTREVKATYTKEGSTLNMQWDGAGRTKGVIKGDTFTMNNEGMIFSYKKQPAPQAGAPAVQEAVVSKRDINGDFQKGTYVNGWGATMPVLWQSGGEGAFNYKKDGANGYIVLSNPDSDWIVAHTQKPPILLADFGVTAGETVVFGADIIKLGGDGSVNLKLEEYKNGGATANGILIKQISATDSWATYKADFKIKPDTDSVILVLVALEKGASYGFDNVTFASIDAYVKGKVVGVYDSRVIALAYWQQEIDGKARMHRHEDLGIKAMELGLLMHQQVFSYHKPVQALEYIGDKLPAFMKQNKVDVLVCMWDKEELAKYNVVGSGWDDDFSTNDPNVVDLIVKFHQLFDPTATQKKYDKGFGRGKPAPLDTDWKNAEE